MTEERKQYNPSTFRLLWQNNRLLFVLMPMFLLALVGMALAKYYLTGTDFILALAISFGGLIFMLPYGFMYLPFQGMKSMHLNLRCDMHDEEFDLFYTRQRPLNHTVLYEIPIPNSTEKLQYCETKIHLDQKEDFTAILRNDGLSLYPESDSEEWVFFRHFRVLEDRLGTHGEMAVLQGVPFWHKHSETVICRALDPKNSQISDGKLQLHPCFEIIFSLSKDYDLFAKYQELIWMLIMTKEIEEKRRQPPLVTV